MKLKNIQNLFDHETNVYIYDKNGVELAYLYNIYDSDINKYLDEDINLITATCEDVIAIYLKNFQKVK